MRQQEHRNCARCGTPFSIHRNTLAGQACDLALPITRIYVVFIYKPIKPVLLWLAGKLRSRDV